MSSEVLIAVFQTDILLLLSDSFQRGEETVSLAKLRQQLSAAGDTLVRLALNVAIIRQHLIVSSKTMKRSKQIDARLSWLICSFSLVHHDHRC